MDPIIHLGLTQLKEFAHDDLKRIGLEVDQYKEEFILGPRQVPLATPTSRTLPGLTFGGEVGGMHLLISLWEESKKMLKLPWRQPREGQQLPAIGLKYPVC
jgi:hypothetical protein